MAEMLLAGDMRVGDKFVADVTADGSKIEVKKT